MPSIFPIEEVAMDMQPTPISEGAKVTIHYTLSVSGEVIDTSTGKEPLSYVQGDGQLIAGVEEQLSGLRKGDRKDFQVPPEKAYGNPDPGALQRVPKEAFKNPDDLQEGDWIRGMASGRAFQARIADVTAEDITLDLNHPLAGKTLHFEIEVVEVQH